MTERAHAHTHTHTHTHTKCPWSHNHDWVTLGLESLLVTDRVGVEQAVLVFLPGPGGGAAKEKRGFQLKRKVVLIFVSCFF